LRPFPPLFSPKGSRCWDNANYYTEHYDAEKQIRDIRANAVISSHAVLAAAQTGFLPRSEIGVQGVFDAADFERIFVTAVRFEVLNWVAFKTSTLVRYASGHMSTLFTLAIATLEARRQVLDEAQSHALASMFGHISVLGKGLFTGKTASFKAVSSFSAMHLIHGAFWLPQLPTLLRRQLGVPLLSGERPVVFPASFGQLYAKPGVAEKRAQWDSLMNDRYPRPVCGHCGRVFRNVEMLHGHLDKEPDHKIKGHVRLMKHVYNRAVVECEIKCLDEAQKVFIRLLLEGVHVVMIAGAGCGKTAALKAWLECLKTLLNEQQFKEFIAVLGPTNKIAANISGGTFNSNFAIGKGQDEKDANELFDRFIRSPRAVAVTAKRRLICIDEVFKMGKILFDFLVLALLHGCGPFQLPGNPFEVSSPGAPPPPSPSPFFISFF
jgi:hypothetical protein